MIIDIKQLKGVVRYVDDVFMYIKLIGGGIVRYPRTKGIKKWSAVWVSTEIGRQDALEVILYENYLNKDIRDEPPPSDYYEEQEYVGGIDE